MKRFLALLLSVLMLAALLPSGVLAEETEVPAAAEDAAEEPAQEPEAVPEQAETEPAPEPAAPEAQQEAAPEAITEETAAQEEPLPDTQSEPEAPAEEPQPDEQTGSEPPEGPTEEAPIEEEPAQEPEQTVISLSPLQDAVIENGSAAFVCRASGNAGEVRLYYQWQCLDIGRGYENDFLRAEAWEDIPGATEAKLAFDNIDPETYETEYACFLFRCLVHTEDDTEISGEARLLPDPAWSAEDMTEETPEQEELPAQEADEDLAPEELIEEPAEELPAEEESAEEPETEEPEQTPEAPAEDADETGSEEPGNGTDEEPEEEEKQLLSDPIRAGYCGETLEWTLSQEYVLTITGTGAMWNYRPDEPAPWIDYAGSIVSVSLGSGVSSIGDYAFIEFESLTGITIPNSVLSIGQSAFSGCEALTAVNIPGSVKSIGDSAFSYCTALSSLTLHEGLTAIGSSAFRYCTQLTGVTLPFGVRTLGESVFSNCSALRTLTVPYSVSSIGKTLLYNCGALEKVEYTANAALWTGVDVDQDNASLLLHPEYNSSVSQAGRFGTDFTWVLYTSGLLDIAGTGSMGDYTIDTVPWRRVANSVSSVRVFTGITNIGSYAFCQFPVLTSVTVPNTVTVIGDRAFYKCSALENVSLPAGTVSIGAFAFTDCIKLSSVTIPGGISKIEESTFSGCTGLASITIPATVTEIGKEAFRHCSGLASITIPAGVREIGQGAFMNCSGLTSINVADGNTKYRAEGNCLISLADSKLILGCSSSVIPTGVKSIGEYAFSNCSQLSFDYLRLPDSVTSIAERAFYNCTGLRFIDIGKGLASFSTDAFEGCSGITKIEVDAGNTVYRSEGNCLIRRSTNAVVKGCKTSVIPAGVKKIGEMAFEGCSGLEELEIPNGVTSIGSRAFLECSGLYWVSIPGTVRVIEEGAFAYCEDLYDVTICAGVAKIGDDAFYGCKMLTGIHIPGSVTSLGDYAFYECIGMTSVEWGYGIKTIGKYAFAKCTALAAACLPDSVTSLGDWAFYECGSIEKATVPGSAASVGKGVFSGCAALKEVMIGIGVRSIGDEAFRGAAALEEVTVPYGVTSLGNEAFCNCSGLKTVSLPFTLQSVGSDAFKGCETLTVAYYPGEAEQWEKITVLPGNDLMTDHLRHEVTVIDEGIALSVNWTLYSDGRLVFSGSGAIQDYARGSVAPWHKYSNGILSVIIDNGITGIGNWAFYECGMITSVTIPNSVTSVGRNAFRDCRNLAVIELPDTVTAIGGAAFYGCPALERINIPARITQLGDGTFGNCADLRSVTLPAGLLSIGAGVFENCTELEQITVPEMVTAIGDSAFNGCGSLISVDLPAGLESIGENAFADCERIRTVAFSGNRTEWDLLRERSGSGNGDLFGAENIVFKLISSGKCGDKLTWSVSASGVLTVSGTGDMYDYTYADPAPWSSNDAAYPVTSLVLKKGITYLGDNAFYGLNVQNVSVPAGVKGIGKYTFGNASFRSLSLPSSLKSIGEGAFSGCGNLAGLTIPSAVGSIGNYAFYGCSSLSSVAIAVNGTQTGEAIFGACAGLTSVIIGDGVTEIGNSWFIECANLTNVRMPASVTSVRENAFSDCALLAEVYFAGTADQWDEISIEEGNSSLFTNLNPLLTVHIQEGKTYTVLFSANGGEGGTALQSFVYGVAQPLRPNTFTRTGYIFSGWKCGRTVYKDAQTVKNLSSAAGATVTLEAQWKVDTEYPGYRYTVRFNGNGNTGGDTVDEAMCVGTAKALTANRFIKTGFHFAGWATSEHGEALYKDKQTVKDLNLACGEMQEAVLYAVWAPNTYTVSFNGNGGKLPNGKKTAYKQQITYGSREMLERNRYVRTGYTFLGWSTDKKATGAMYTDAQVVAFDLTAKHGGKITFYAVWKANTYYVEFRKGAVNVKGVMGTQTLSYGKSARLVNNEFSYPGYSFAGWQCSNGRVYKNKASVKNLCAEGNRYITMTAKWTPNTYKVVFKANGGKGTAPAAATGYADTTKVVIPESGALSFAGGRFVGWNTKADSTGIWYAPGEKTVFNCRNKATVSLYAIWEYTATFCLGTCAGTKIDVSIPLALYYNKPQRVVKDGFGNIPETDGYCIAGWNKSENKAIKGYIQYKAEAVKNVGADTTLYAVWKPIRYTVAFNANSGTGTMKKLSMTYGTAKTLIANAFKKDGAEFLGWSLTADGPVEFTDKQSVRTEIVPRTEGQTVTLYAVWSV